MLLSHLFPAQPVNSAGHEQHVEVNCCLYFDQTGFLIAAGAPAWPPVQKAETCHALVLLPVPSHSSTPELCQGQNTASIWATENTRDSQNLWKSKTTNLGSRQWQMSRVCSLAHCMCRFYHLCKSLKAMRDCLVACTDGLCIKVLPSSGLALHVNEVWNNVWAGQLWNNSRGKENGEKEEGGQKSRGMGLGRRGAWELMGCEVHSERYTVAHLPAHPLLAWQGAATAPAATWNVQNSSFVWLMNTSVTMQKVCWRKNPGTCDCSSGACKFFFAPLKGQRSN